MQAYHEVDQRIHQLAQTIAKFNRSYAAPQADDGHTNLAYDPVGERLVGRWVETPQGKVIMVLDLQAFTFELFNYQWKRLHTTDIAGRTQIEIEQSLQPVIHNLGLNADAFTEPLHFEIPAYDFAKEVFDFFEPAHLDTWQKQRALANEASYALLTHLNYPCEVRIWPHHFDTGIYVEPTHKVGVGFGLAMQGSLDRIHVPYYYFSAYGLNGHTVDYSTTTPLPYGVWIKGDWNGAVLPISIAKTQSLRQFTRATAEWYLQHCMDV